MPWSLIYLQSWATSFILDLGTVCLFLDFELMGLSSHALIYIFSFMLGCSFYAIFCFGTFHYQDLAVWFKTKGTYITFQWHFAILGWWQICHYAVALGWLSNMTSQERGSLLLSAKLCILFFIVWTLQSILSNLGPSCKTPCGFFIWNNQTRYYSNSQLEKYKKNKHRGPSCST